MAVGLEPDVDAYTLPVFYYNDFLVASIGDPIGLNLFEPRYRIMCKRMVEDPRFLFMPNFRDYQCITGDVGFVVRLVSMNESRGAVQIQGTAEQLAAVECTWVEPDTRGLHFARFCALPPQLQPLGTSEFQALGSSLTSNGWAAVRGTNGDAHLYLVNQQVGAQLLVSTNWMDQRGRTMAFFLLLRVAATADPEPVKALIQQAMAPICSPEDASRCLHVLPAFPPSKPLSDVYGDLLNILEGDGVQRQHSEAEVRTLTKGLRICSIGLDTVNAYFPQAEVLVVEIKGDHAWHEQRVIESLPYMKQEFGERLQAVVQVENGKSYFLAPLTESRVTVNSARATVLQLVWRLNSLRRCIVERARDKGHGPLADLEDDVARLVCDYLAVKP